MNRTLLSSRRRHLSCWRPPGRVGEVIVGTPGEHAGRHAQPRLHLRSRRRRRHGRNDGSDFLFGRRVDATAIGDDGRDFLWGRPGNDTLQGGDGPDLLYAGCGADTSRAGRATTSSTPARTTTCRTCDSAVAVTSPSSASGTWRSLRAREVSARAPLTRGLPAGHAGRRHATAGTDRGTSSSPDRQRHRVRLGATASSSVRWGTTPLTGSAAPTGPGEAPATTTSTVERMRWPWTTTAPTTSREVGRSAPVAAADDNASARLVAASTPTITTAHPEARRHGGGCDSSGLSRTRGRRH